MRKILITALITFLGIHCIVAQTRSAKLNGTISGVIVEGNSGTKLDYATVALFNKADSSMITGGLTENGGRFNLNKLPNGQFYIEVNFVGYNKKYINDISLSASNNKLNLGEIEITSSAKQLDEIEVSASRNAISYQVDKKVIDVSKNLSAAGGTAVDALINIPSINVDI